MMSLLRTIISRLANLTPNHFYYSHEIKAYVNDEENLLTLKNGDTIHGVGLGAFNIAAATNQDKRLNNKGDKILFTFWGVQHGNGDKGNFKVTVERLDDNHDH